MQPVLRFGVLGCAGIARRKMMPALAAEPAAELRAVASRTSGRARATAAAFRCEPVTGYRALLERPDIDAIYLPLPAGLHAEWTRAALLAGKHVLVEKPAVLTARDAGELVRLARDRRLLLMENFMFLAHSMHATVSELVLAGAIGRLRAMTADFGIPSRPADDIRYRPELGGGALNDIGVHPLRLSRWFLGDALTVAGACSVVDERHRVDVTGSVLLRNSDGVTAQISYGFQHAYRSMYALWGDGGRIEIQRAFTPPPDRRPVLRLERPEGVEERVLAADDQFRNVVRRFTRAVPEAAARDAAGRDLVRQATLLEAARDAAGHRRIAAVPGGR